MLLPPSVTRDSAYVPEGAAEAVGTAQVAAAVAVTVALNPAVAGAAVLDPSRRLARRHASRTLPRRASTVASLATGRATQSARDLRAAEAALHLAAEAAEYTLQKSPMRFHLQSPVIFHLSRMGLSRPEMYASPRSWHFGH